MVEPCSWNLLALTAAHEQNRAADRTYIKIAFYPNTLTTSCLQCISQKALQPTNYWLPVTLRPSHAPHTTNFLCTYLDWAVPRFWTSKRCVVKVVCFVMELCFISITVRCYATPPIKISENLANNLFIDFGTPRSHYTTKETALSRQLVNFWNS